MSNDPPFYPINNSPLSTLPHQAGRGGDPVSVCVHSCKNTRTGPPLLLSTHSHSPQPVLSRKEDDWREALADSAWHQGRLKMQLLSPVMTFDRLCLRPPAASPPPPPFLPRHTHRRDNCLHSLCPDPLSPDPQPRPFSSSAFTMHTLAAHPHTATELLFYNTTLPHGTHSNV